MTNPAYESYVVQVAWTYPGKVPEFFGPFDGEDAANLWAEANIPLPHLISYRVAALASPEPPA